MQNKTNLDHLFYLAQQQEITYSFEDLKAAFEKQTAGIPEHKPKRVNRMTTFKTMLMSTAVIGLGSLILIILRNTHSTSQYQAPLKFSNVKKASAINKVISTKVHTRLKKEVPEFITDREEILVRQEERKEELGSNPVFTTVLNKYGDWNLAPYPLNHHDVVPVLTAEEIAENNKQKKNLIRALKKVDKDTYVTLKLDSFSLELKKYHAYHFVMQRTEVTNLQYRTFLLDLLIQGRTADYFIAKPDEEQWILLKMGQQMKLKEYYFIHPSYNDYPVVNISRKAAEMYCDWLTEELYKVTEEKKQAEISVVRLPTRDEWISAASSGGTTYPYPWNGIYRRNSRGCFLANFNPYLSQDGEKLDDDGGQYTVAAKFYTPNKVGLYQMSGNVAEMVYEDLSSKIPGTAGGGWLSNSEQIKILGPDKYAGEVTPNPCIGFRILMPIVKKQE